MIHVGYPQHIWLIAGLALVAGIYLWYMIWRRKAIRRLGDYQLVRNLLEDYSIGKSIIRFAIIVIVYVLIVVGLMNLQWGAATRNVHHNGIDIAFLMDVSNSMRATDAETDRLEAAKSAAKKLCDLFPDSRIAIVAFAGSSSTVLPLTPDHAAAQMVLTNLSTDYAQIQGSDLGSALIEALHALPPNQNRYRAIVLLSDGEDHEHKVSTAISQLNQAGIVLCTVGTGTDAGSEIPLTDSSGGRGVKRDAQGKIVVTKMNAVLLRELSEKANGVFTVLQNNPSAINTIASRLNAVQQNTFDEKIFAQYESRFQYFLLPALMLLIAETFIGNRKRTRKIKTKPEPELILQT